MSKHHKPYILILITLAVFSHNQVTAFECTANTNPFIGSLNQFGSTHSAMIVDSKIAIQKATNALSNSLNVADELPIDVQLAIQSQTTNATDNFFDADTTTESATMGASIDVTPWTFLANQTLTGADIQLKELQLAQTNQTTKSLITSNLVEISKALSLLALVRERIELVNSKQQYFLKRRELGSFDQQAIYASSELLQSLKDQERSLAVRATSLMADLNLPSELMPQVPKMHSIGYKRPLVSNCSRDMFWEVKLNKLNSKLAQISLEQVINSRLPSLTAEIEHSQIHGPTRMYSQNAITLIASTPLYSGSSISNQQQLKEMELKIAKETVEASLIKANLEIIKQNNVQDIFERSVQSVSNDIANRSNSLNELGERNRLGQSVFVELIDTALELKELEAQRIRVLADSLDSWASYVNLFDQRGSRY